MSNVTLVPDRVVLLERHSEKAAVRKESRVPVWRTMGYTLDISSRFLMSSAVGNGTIQRCDDLLDSYWRRIFTSGNAEFAVEGRHHFQGHTSTVVMTNHGSLIDIPAIMGAVPGSRVRMVFKEELRRVPVWGQACVASGFIPIDRKNRTKAIAQLEKAKEVLQKGVHVWVSPEGTRSRSHNDLLPFKKGGFHTALALGVPIMPGWIEGASDILPPDQFIVRYDGTITVRFGPVIETKGKTAADIEDLMRQVRESIVKLSGRPDPRPDQVSVPETQKSAA